MDDTAHSGGRRPRSLKGGNRGPGLLGGAVRYGDSDVARGDSVGWTGRVRATWGGDWWGWSGRASHFGTARTSEREAETWTNAALSRASTSPVEDRRHRRAALERRALV